MQKNQKTDPIITSPTPPLADAEVLKWLLLHPAGWDNCKCDVVGLLRPMLAKKGIGQRNSMVQDQVWEGGTA